MTSLLIDITKRMEDKGRTLATYNSQGLKSRTRRELKEMTDSPAEKCTPDFNTLCKKYPNIFSCMKKVFSVVKQKQIRMEVLLSTLSSELLRWSGMKIPSEHTGQRELWCTNSVSLELCEHVQIRCGTISPSWKMEVLRPTNSIPKHKPAGV